MGEVVVVVVEVEVAMAVKVVVQFGQTTETCGLDEGQESFVWA
jgi:hypothetical protein